MSHELEKRNGRTSFAYNEGNGLPWHKLGTPFDGKQPLKVMLATVGADFEAYEAPAMADGRLGLASAEKYVAICADRVVEKPEPHQVTQIFAFMGSGYEIVQYERVAERAVAVCGESDGAAIFDAMGLLYKGHQFFATLDLGELIIDPRGIADTIERYLVIRSSHDGSYAVTYVPSNIRAVCKNTCDFAMEGATRTLKARHTTNVDQKLEKEEAQRVLGFSTEWAEQYKATAERMLSVQFTPGLWDAVIDSAFPMPHEPSERQRNNVLRAHKSIRELFENENNAGGFGKSGWTMFNAVVEYLDHGRPGTPQNRALASMTPGTIVDQKKTTVAKRILAARSN